MSVQENKIKGGVITMGSLFWENGRNCLKDKNELDSKGKIKSVELAKYRIEWRNENLVITDAKQIQLPIRYGKQSDTRKKTYTMVFSREYLNKKCFGQIIPFKDEIDFQKNGTLEEQARKMAQAEGIKDRNDNVFLVLDWCAMALWIDSTSIHAPYLRKEWLSIVNPPNNYFRNKRNTITNAPSNAERNATDYSGHNDAVLLNNDFELIDVPIKCKFDFLLLTYTKPNISYPNAKTIADAINDKNSRYNSYLRRNIGNGIVTVDDEEIKSHLDNPLKF